MSQVATVKIDTSEWAKAIQDFKAHSSRSIPQILNRSAGIVALKAFRMTTRADKTKMQDQLYSGKRGKRTRSNGTVARFKRPSDMAYGIMRKKLGLKGNRNEELGRLTRKFVGGRMSSRGFFAIGWLPAAIELLGKDFKGDVKMRGKLPVGRAKRAMADDYYSEAIIDHLVDRAARFGNAPAALQKAIAEETAGLRKEIVNRAIKDGLRKTGGTVA